MFRPLGRGVIVSLWRVEHSQFNTIHSYSCIEYSVFINYSNAQSVIHSVYYTLYSNTVVFICLNIVCSSYTDDHYVKLYTEQCSVSTRYVFFLIKKNLLKGKLYLHQLD